MSITQDRRAWIAGSIVVALLLALASWFLLISPTFSSSSSLRAQRDDVELQNTLLQSKIGKLKAQNDNIATLKQDLGTAAAGLPTGSGISDFTRQVTGQSRLAGVNLLGITASDPTPVVAAGTTAKPTAGSAAGTLFSSVVTITSVGPATKEYEFLRMLQHVGPRRVLITSTSITPGAGSQVGSIDGSANMVTVLNVFSAPVTPAAQAALQKLLASGS